MKNNSLSLFVLLVLIGVVPLEAQQENDPAATAVLERISAQAASAKNVHYQFDLGIDPPEEDSYTLQGEHFQAQDMFYLDLPKLRFVTNGISQWVVDKERKEIQIHDFVPSELDQLTDPKILLTIHENPHFRHRLIEEDLIEFMPIDRDFEYFRATMHVSEDTIKAIEVWSKDGYTYQLIIKAQQFNVELTADKFIVDPLNYPGHHVEDLRID